jgi:hypothetical protein
MTDSTVEATEAAHNTGAGVLEVSPLVGGASAGGDTATTVNGDGDALEDVVTSPGSLQVVNTKVITHNKSHT